jgi:hypothetical protein
MQEDSYVVVGVWLRVAAGTGAEKDRAIHSLPVRCIESRAEPTQHWIDWQL